MTDAYREQVVLLNRMADAAERQDQVGFSALGEDVQRVNTRARGIAVGYGFKVCGDQ